MHTSIPSRPFSLNSYLRVVATAFMGALLLTAGSKISIPIGPVPVTLQMLAVFSLILLYPARLAALSGLAWLALGMFVPVFATPGAFTLAALVGPSGGYIIGMVLALGLAGYLADYAKQYLVPVLPLSIALPAVYGWVGRLLELTVAFALIYAIGLLWLGAYVPGKVLTTGLLPFLGYDTLKLLAALLIGGTLHGVRQSLRKYIFG